MGKGPSGGYAGVVHAAEAISGGAILIIMAKQNARAT